MLFIVNRIKNILHTGFYTGSPWARGMCHLRTELLWENKVHSEHPSYTFPLCRCPLSSPSPGPISSPGTSPTSSVRPCPSIPRNLIPDSTTCLCHSFGLSTSKGLFLLAWVFTCVPPTKLNISQKPAPDSKFLTSRILFSFSKLLSIYVILFLVNHLKSFLDQDWV